MANDVSRRERGRALLAPRFGTTTTYFSAGLGIGRAGAAVSQLTQERSVHRANFHFSGEDIVVEGDFVSFIALQVEHLGGCHL
jgi:hypothetical protein